MALRFLPHNCTESEVPRLLHSFFDDYAVCVDGTHICGLEKRGAMSIGRIDLGCYNIGGSGTLRFSWPGKNPGRPAYPLEELFRTLFSWFSAYYTLARLPVPEDEVLDAQEEDAKAIPGARTMKPDLTGLQPPPSPEPSDAEPPVLGETRLDRQKRRRREELEREKRYRTALEELAKNLESHEPMLYEIAKALEKEWPPLDRCHDREPKHGYVPPKDIVSMGKKRCRSSSSGSNPSPCDRPAKRSKT